MRTFVSGMHILVLDIWSVVDVKCMTGAYTYAHKFYAARQNPLTSRSLAARTLNATGQPWATLLLL